MKKISIILVVFLIIQTPEALAAINGQGILDDVQNQFQSCRLWLGFHPNSQSILVVLGARPDFYGVDTRHVVVP